ncbi:MAG: enoyl-CoA hydratase/isomerase family protein [Spirochaetes bacterium]|nr:enoyl-CoA hydratase/isomerase family protein [Spirochaetota bacterium]
MNEVFETFQDDICTITLNRPDKKNAMNYDLFKALLESFTKAEAEKPSIIVLRGSGKVFCSGGDLIDFKDAKDKKALVNEEADMFNKIIKIIRNTSAIVIAVLESVVIGAGAGLAAACDLSIATKKTIMNLGYRRIGLTPDGGGSILISRIVGAKKFNELYLFSKNISMDEAQKLGLVNFVVDEEELEERLQKMIDELKSLPMETIIYFKELVNQSLYSGLDSQLDKERQFVTELAGKKEFQERLEGFFKKK